MLLGASRLVYVSIILVTLSLAASVPAASGKYWLFLKDDDGHTWCGYTDQNQFTSDVKEMQPTDTVRLTYSADQLTEVTFQVEPESGDWVVVDKYTPSKDGFNLRRANLLTQGNLQIIEEASIHGGKVEPFRVVNTTTLDGKKATLPANVDLPKVSIMPSLSEMPFLAVAAEMRKQSVSKLCRS